jgi:transposase
MIYIRPDWYLNYVKNLAWLLALKFKLDLQKFDISVFERMTKFATENKCSLKGIIDYEIAKKRGKREFFIPVFYSSPTRLAASGDSIAFTDYLQKAKEAKEFTIKYMMYEGNYPIPFDGEEITNLLNLKFSIKTENYFYYTDAYKLKF